MEYRGRKKVILLQVHPSTHDRRLFMDLIRAGTWTVTKKRRLLEPMNEVETCLSMDEGDEVQLTVEVEGEDREEILNDLESKLHPTGHRIEKFYPEDKDETRSLELRDEIENLKEKKEAVDNIIRIKYGLIEEYETDPDACEHCNLDQVKQCLQEDDPGPDSCERLEEVRKRNLEEEKEFEEMD